MPGRPPVRNRWLLNRFVSGLCVASSLAAWAGPAFAYRPFDGTDAAVAAPGEVEIELQPAGRLCDETGTSLIAPATVINYGLSEGWEAVLEGLGQTPLSPSGPTSLRAAGAFLKHVLQPGSLQDKTGPSIATEFGVLLPDSTIAPLRNVATYQSRHTPVLFSLHAAGLAETRRSLRKSGNTIWRCRSPRTRCPVAKVGYGKTTILRSPRRFDCRQDHFADWCRMP